MPRIRQYEKKTRSRNEFDSFMLSTFLALGQIKEKRINKQELNDSEEAFVLNFYKLYKMSNCI